MLPTGSHEFYSQLLTSPSHQYLYNAMHASLLLFMGIQTLRDTYIYIYHVGAYIQITGLGGHDCELLILGVCFGKHQNCSVKRPEEFELVEKQDSRLFGLAIYFGSLSECCSEFESIESM